MSDVRSFKQTPRDEDRPASVGFKVRWNDFIEAFAEKQVLDGNDMIDWRLGWGLTGRTFREEYLGPAMRRGIIEPFGRPAKYRVCDSYSSGHEETATEYMQRKSAEKKPRLSKKALDLFEKMEIRESMECNAGCKPLYPDKDCRECSAYTNKIAYEKQQREGEPSFLEEE